MTEIDADLAAAGGAGDGAADTVAVEGTSGDDVAVVAGDAAGLQVFGLATRVNVTGAEAANDRLLVRALAGDDVVDASSVATGAAKLTLDGGADDDVLIGGDGDDVLLGGDGDDVLLGGPGIDTVDGGPGDNIVIQGLVADDVTSAATVGEAWLADNAYRANGKTVVRVGGEERTLPRADLSDLVRHARAS
jgi:Ca2+-binding RTX toxin-like protein